MFKPIFSKNLISLLLLFLTYCLDIHVILCTRFEKLYPILLGQGLPFLERNHPLLFDVTFVADQNFIDVYVRVLKSKDVSENEKNRGGA